MTGCLNHIKVLDFSRVFAGPWAAQMLADFGADVIKVEHVKGGDDVRRMGVPHLGPDGAPTGETSSFLAMNRESGWSRSISSIPRGRRWQDG